MRVTTESRPRGPADNAIILVDRDSGRGRYLSWIGYFDLDCAAAMQPGRWSIVDPATTWEREIDWNPFGRSRNKRRASPTWNGGPTDGLVLPRDGGVMRPARQSRYRQDQPPLGVGGELGQIAGKQNSAVSLYASRTPSVFVPSKNSTRTRYAAWPAR